MKQLLPHISIGTHESGHVVLMVEEYELFDFIEDYLVEESEIPYEFKSCSDRVGGGQVITMHFPISTRLKELEESLLKLSTELIEEIYLFNNKPS